MKKSESFKSLLVFVDHLEYFNIFISNLFSVSYYFRLIMNFLENFNNFLNSVLKVNA